MKIKNIMNNMNFRNIINIMNTIIIKTCRKNNVKIDFQAMICPARASFLFIRTGITQYGHYIYFWNVIKPPGPDYT